MALPAPYSPPWKRLGEDLVAILAWLGLKVRELWRRNREGTLPAPTFWPRAWVQLFWPLVLAAALVAVLVAALALVRPWMLPSPPPPAGEISPQEPREVGLEPSAEPQEESEQPPLPSPGPTQPEEGEGDLKPEAPELEETAAVAFPPTLPDAGSPEPDLLEEAWRADDPEGWIVARNPEPDSATLRLELKDGFGGLSLAKRQRWAERWQARATELGYSHLELWNGQHQLVGRGALVGRGMILLRPSRSERQSP